MRSAIETGHTVARTPADKRNLGPPVHCKNDTSALNVAEKGQMSETATAEHDLMAEAAQTVHELETRPGTMRSDGKPYPPMTEKMQAFAVLHQAGFDPVKAYKILNNRKSVTKSDISYALKRSKSFQLARPARIKAAAKAIDETLAMLPQIASEIKSLDGKTIGTKYVAPTVSNRLEAAKMILDRADPIHQVIDHNVRVEDYDPFDMAGFEVIPAQAIAEGSTIGNSNE